jgi:hypothetical protein
MGTFAKVGVSRRGMIGSAVGSAALSAVLNSGLPGRAGSAEAAPAAQVAAASPSPGAGTDASLVSLWLGDGTADDRVGGNDGALQNGAAFGSGRVGQAFRLDGVDDYVKIPDDPSLTVESLTLAAWVYPDTVAGNRTIISKYHFDDASGRVADVSWLLYALDGRVSLVAYGQDGNGHRGAKTTAAILTPGKWHHVAATFDLPSQTARIFHFGREVASSLYEQSTTIGRIGDSGAPVRIGAQYTRRLEGFWAGRIDEVEIYDRALSAEEVRSIRIRQR